MIGVDESEKGRLHCGAPFQLWMRQNALTGPAPADILASVSAWVMIAQTMDEPVRGTEMARRTKVDYVAAVCAGLCGFAFLAAAAGGLESIRSGNAETAWLLIAAMVGPALASLMFFSELGRRVGWLGLAADLGFMMFAIFVGILLAGTLASPAVGTILAPVYVWIWLGEMPALWLVFVFGMIVALILSRSRRHAV